MMQRGHKRGFTVVELMIVIAVIAVLATLLSSMFIGAQVQARDTKLQDAADKVIDAVKLFTANMGHFPKGGWGSTAVIGSNKECVDGKDGFFGAEYSCTVFDTLVASGYLPPGLMDSLPSNTRIPNTIPRRSIMLYVDTGAASRAILMISQEAPTADTNARFEKAISQCGIDATRRDNYYTGWGMRDAYCFDY